MIERLGRAFLAQVENPLIRWMTRLRLTPNRISWLGLLLALGTSAIIAFGYLRTGGILFIVTSAVDSLDGLLARGTDQVTRFGACLDSTLDRVSEMLILLGLILYFQHSGPLRLPLEFSIPLAFTAMGCSVAVSYVKARAEGLGMDCKVGWMQRSERIVVLGLGMVFGVVDLLLIPLCLLMCATVGQRLWHVARQDSGP